MQPGIGNPVPADRTLTLADMSERTLKVLATRKDIACVLVNPLQAMHPNGSAPSDGQLVDGGRKAGRIWPPIATGCTGWRKRAARTASS